MVTPATPKKKKKKKADPAHHAAHEAVALRHGAQGVDHTAAHQTEIAGIQGNVDFRHLVEQAIKSTGSGDLER
ncbi:hypothetical protein [Herbaspirillum huttiense]|uniref:hypothetical protein n=1 Tax=Herbaspirillum huttiense TaxID=863372 RepID=UPI001E63F6E9|nr:hypothetical protein [Herbaspirillum huttiense]